MHKISHQNEFNFFNEMPFTCGSPRLAHIHLRTLMRVQLHFHLHINQMRVSAVQLISTVINFFALCVFADAYWIG